MPMPDALSQIPPQAPNRVYYALGRMLGVEDFQADQDYHRGRLARALLQLCGTGTIAGLKVSANHRVANAGYATWSFVLDAAGNVQANVGAGGKSGAVAVTFAAAAGATTLDGTVTWTNEGPLLAAGWRAATAFAAPSAIVDPAGNVQLATGAFTSGATAPVWSASAGGVTADGAAAKAWVCLGALEVVVTAGVAVDRVGRLIEVPRAVCVPLAAWLAAQSASDMNLAMHGANVIVDVFATFVPCTRGVTPSFAAQADVDATDAFSPNRWLDSFAMQLVLRTDAAPQLPRDPWLALGPVASPPAGSVKALQTALLEATSGPDSGAPLAEYPPNFDSSSVFLARLSIPATAVPPAAAGVASPPALALGSVAIDNFSRLFLYASSLVARLSGLASGAES